jgi:hypothetical protein
MNLGSADQDLLLEVTEFMRDSISLSLPSGLHEATLSEKRDFLFDRLNRPLRVCGMVRNEGEPGGGPHWVKCGDGTLSPQIVESSQVDMQSQAQKAVWGSATHFNPVDLVCGVRDHRGKKFDLARFADPALAIIARKSEQGRELLALERPGLWNGSMAFWNTLFVEVPLATFNPVKTVSDLLRPQHLSS